MAIEIEKSNVDEITGIMNVSDDYFNEIDENDPAIKGKSLAQIQEIMKTAPTKPQAQESEEDTATAQEGLTEDGEEEAAQPATGASEFQPITAPVRALYTEDGASEFVIDSEEKLQEITEAYLNRERWQKSFTERDETLAAERKYIEQNRPILDMFARFPEQSAEAQLVKALSLGYSAEQIFASVAGANRPAPNKDEDPVGYLEHQINQLRAQRQAPAPQNNAQEAAMVEGNTAIVKDFYDELKSQYSDQIVSPEDWKYVNDKLYGAMVERGYNGANKVIPTSVLRQTFAETFPNLANRKQKMEESKQRAAKKGRNLGTPTKPTSGASKESKFVGSDPFMDVFK